MKDQTYSLDTIQFGGRGMDRDYIVDQIDTYTKYIIDISVEMSRIGAAYDNEANAERVRKGLHLEQDLQAPTKIMQVIMDKLRFLDQERNVYVKLLEKWESELEKLEEE